MTDFLKGAFGVGMGIATIGILNRTLGSSRPKYDRKYLYARQLAIGTKVEMEHTKNPRVAQKIAQDHLREFPDYYDHLLPMEEQLKKEWSKKKRWF